MTIIYYPLGGVSIPTNSDHYFFLLGGITLSGQGVSQHMFEETTG